MTPGPEVKAKGGIYRCLFRDDRVTLQVERVQENRSGVSGEVTVTTSAPGLNPYLHQARVGLLSTSSQRGFAQYLKNISAALEHLNWQRMVADVCRQVVRQHRQGEPVMTLAKHPSDENPTSRLDPILPDQKAALFFGDGGSAKTLTVVNYLGLLIASGLNKNGFTPEPGRIMILDYETDVDETKERFEAVARGLGISVPENIFYRYMVQSVSADIERLQREVLDKEIDYVFIDSAGSACGGEPESAEAATKYFAALRSLRIGSATIAHVSKDRARDPFGSVYWKNLPRSVSRITSTQKPGESTFDVSISNTKSNWGEYPGVVGLKVTFDGSSVRFNRLDATAEPDLFKTLTQRDQIKVVLKNGKQPSAQLAKTLGANANSIRSTLSRYKDKEFMKIGNEWALGDH